MRIQEALLGTVGLIGAYMVLAFWGNTAPMLSGAAFILIAIHDWISD